MYLILFDLNSDPDSLDSKEESQSQLLGFDTALVQVSFSFPFPAIPTSSSTTSVDGVEMSGLALILQHGTRLAEARSSKATQTGSQQPKSEFGNKHSFDKSTRDKNVTTLKV